MMGHPVDFVKNAATVVAVGLRPTAATAGSVSWLVGISLCPNSVSGTARETTTICLSLSSSHKKGQKNNSHYMQPT